MNIDFSLRQPSVDNFGVKNLIVVFLIGLIFTGVGYFATKSVEIDSSWKKINGTIVDVVVNQDTDVDPNDNTVNNSPTYSPVVNYQVNEQTYRITSSVGTSSKPTIGSTIKVAYNPNKPSEAKVVESKATKMMFYLFYVIGLGLIVYGCVMFALGLRRKNMI